MTEITSKLSNALADRYKIERHLGEGGMATVYLAEDLKHERKVALKVLKPELAAVLGAERFVQEIKTTANLQHPHILPLFDSGTAGRREGGTEFLYYVMPFIDGETLRDKLNRETQLGIEEAVRITCDVADALDYAHQQGVIHRDIKPENVLLHNGRPMVTDFGIALAVSAAAGGRMTETGLSLGTPHYMSPEQATAEKDLTARSDIYSLGSVLYEMLTGSPPHVGSSAQQIIMKIVAEDVQPVTELRKSVPPHVAAATTKSLENLAADRFESAAKFAEALTNSAFVFNSVTRMQATRPSSAGTQNRTAVAFAALSGVLALLLGLTVLGQPNANVSDVGVARFPLVGNPNFRINTGSTQPFAISSDGGTIIFAADTGNGMHLWVRTLADPTPRMLEGTDRATQPAISPDGEWIAFVVDNHIIRKARLDGGGVEEVASIDNISASVSWASSDEILFELIGIPDGIHRVSAFGGRPELLIPLDTTISEVRHRRPFVLHHERRVLYASMLADGSWSLAIFSLDDGRRTRLGIDGIQALGVLDGHLVYSRDDGALMAVPFDVRGMRTRGDPRQLRDRVLSSPTGTAVILSTNGNLVYRAPVAQPMRLFLVDSAGSLTQLGTWVRPFDTPRFSPDDRYAAVTIADEGDTQDLWIVDRATGEATQLTRGAQAHLQDWTPDGSSLIYSEGRVLWTIRIDGSGGPRRITAVEGTIRGASIMPDGASIIVSHSDIGTLTEELVRASLLDSSVTPIGSAGRLRPFFPRVSPDGRWVAYHGRNDREVHISSIDSAGRVQVSDAGGYAPIVWGPNSDRVYYHTSAGITVAEIRTNPRLAVVRRRELHGFPFFSTVHDVTDDGRTFLVVAPVGGGNEDILVALNWGSEVLAMLRNQND